MGARSLIIGIDGAEWSVIRQLQDEGLLPNLTRLIRNGASAPLNSTTPPMTLPSWSSMLTGCHPGTHGITKKVGKSRKGLLWYEFLPRTSRFTCIFIYTHIRKHATDVHLRISITKFA